jgi:hypothetical protein
MNAAPKFTDYAPTVEAAILVEETLDNFRHRAREDGFPPSVKIGNARFYKRADLQVWKRERDRNRKTK